jgi:hypothetical protein
MILASGGTISRPRDRAAATAESSWPAESLRWGGHDRQAKSLALLATGDAEAAVERLHPILELPSEMRLATFNGKLARVTALASAPQHHSSPAARGLSDQVRAYLGYESDSMPYPLVLSPAAAP